MEYLLTQKEFDALTPVKRLQERNEALDFAREFIVDLLGLNCGKHYCDVCPLSDIGGDWPEVLSGKLRYSIECADRPSRSISKHICPLSRAYGK